MTKRLTLTPKARDHLLDLRAQSDAFAQLPAKKMTREEKMKAFFGDDDA